MNRHVLRTYGLGLPQDLHGVAILQTPRARHHGCAVRWRAPQAGRAQSSRAKAVSASDCRRRGSPTV